MCGIYIKAEEELSRKTILNVVRQAVGQRIMHIDRGILTMDFKQDSMETR